MLLATAPGWVVQAGGAYVATTGDTRTDTAGKVALDSAGNAYVVGFFRDRIDFNGDAIPELLSAGDSDGYLAKYAPDGTFLWATRFGGAGAAFSSPSDTTSGVAVAPDGSVYASGDFVGTADIGGPSLRLTSAGDYDTFVARIDPTTGVVMWAKQIGGISSDQTPGAIVASPDGVFVAGSFQQTVSFGATTLSTTANDAYVTRLDSAGNFVWARKIAGAAQDDVNGLTLDGSGNLYAAGTFLGTGDFAGISLTSYGGADAFLVRLRMEDGVGVWGMHMGSADATWEDEAHALDTDALGNLYVTGLFNHTATFGSFTLTATGSDPRGDFTAKISPAGTILWARQLGSPTEFGNGIGIAVDSATDSVYVAGRLGSAQLARLDLAGNVEWSRSPGSTPISVGRDVAVDAAGIPHLAGYFRDPTVFDTGSGSVPLTSRGGTDIYLLRYNPFGAGVRVLPAAGLVTTENGGSASFSVSLNTQPTADVTIPISSGDATEGIVSVTGLTFTPANWNLPQTVTITGVDDALGDGDVTYSIIVGHVTSSDSNYNGLDPADVSVTNSDNDTKFFVVNDGSPDRTYEYGPSGNAVENYALNAGNTAPRGAASNLAGDRVWVVDANRTVSVYNSGGVLLGSWTAGGLANHPTIEGIATNGTDVWIVDAKQDRVYRYAGAASRLSGSQSADGGFALNNGNSSPKDIVTDGSAFWVVNDASTDKVFKYTLAGALLGSWTITGAGASPTGITLDPSGGGSLWIVDSGTDRVYQFDNARGQTSGSLAPSTSFILAAGNSNPQGIADPPIGSPALGAGPHLQDAAFHDLIGARQSSVRPGRGALSEAIAELSAELIVGWNRAKKHRRNNGRG